MMAYSQCVLFFSCLTVISISAVLAAKSDEVEANSISVRFDSVTLDQWNANANDLLAAFLLTVASNVTLYCAVSDCKLGTDGTTNMPFTVDDVIVMNGYPQDENADVQIVFYMSIEDQTKPEDGNQFALSESVLAVILNENKEEIGAAVGYEVVFIGDERVGAPLDPTLNQILIPLAVGVLVFLVLTTICLHYREKRNEKSHGFGASHSGAPANDASEGVVLTAINKGSSGDEDENPSV